MIVNEKSDQKGWKAESPWACPLQATIFRMHALRSRLLAPDETALPLVHGQMLGKGTVKCVCKNLHFMLFALLFQESHVMPDGQFLEGNRLPDPAHNCSQANQFLPLQGLPLHPQVEHARAELPCGACAADRLRDRCPCLRSIGLDWWDRSEIARAGRRHRPRRIAADLAARI